MADIVTGKRSLASCLGEQAPCARGAALMGPYP
jgi:hypothetical protein